jgi:hypothetical protein
MVCQSTGGEIVRSIYRFIAVLLLSFAVALPLSSAPEGVSTPEDNLAHLPSPTQIQRAVQWEIDILTKNCTECSFYVTYGKLTQTDQSALETGLVYVRYPGFFHRVIRMKRENFNVVFILWPLGIRDVQFEKFLSKAR